MLQVLPLQISFACQGSFFQAIPQYLTKLTASIHAELNSL
jgi:hypothetical protein